MAEIGERKRVAAVGVLEEPVIDRIDGLVGLRPRGQIQPCRRGHGKQQGTGDSTPHQAASEGATVCPSTAERNNGRPYGPGCEGVVSARIGRCRRPDGPNGSRQRSTGRAARRRGSNLHQGRPADPAEVLSGLSPPRHLCADVAHDLRGGAAVGPRHQAEDRQARDAALAHRPQHRRVLAGPVALRPPDRAPRRVGRRGRARRAQGRRAAAAYVRQGVRVDLRRTRSRRPHGERVPHPGGWARLHPYRGRGSRHSPRIGT